ncbi:hypothetical protein M2396_002759 [Pseudomonas sp. BIGb0278]|uniref:hypothetical protein n=1 Tax=Pseudomonas sp. BIGb0278 TaxID=2940607 RepID=UPI0021688B41|nr:hypothetical protein [Pseudomonas sp. BIGb0278]MCS4284463.1 hypothetical protein [Pseudomonas sp. BIGb0278]
MSNNQMISVPEGFMLAERSIWTEQQVDSAAACITLLKGVPGMTDRDLAMAAMDAAQCKAPDITLADILPAEQPQGDPVAVVNEADDGLFVELIYGDNGNPLRRGDKLYTRPAHGEPVWYMIESGLSVMHAKAKALSERNGWDASAYSIPLYTHADPAEVERLRDENRRLHEAGEFLDGVNQGIEDKLRAQLAERDALLGAIAGWTTETRAAVLEAFQDELNESASYAWYDAAIADLMKLVEALSASAEPRPVIAGSVIETPPSESPAIQTTISLQR